MKQQKHINEQIICLYLMVFVWNCNYKMGNIFQVNYVCDYYNFYLTGKDLW